MGQCWQRPPRSMPRPVRQDLAITAVGHRSTQQQQSDPASSSPINSGALGAEHFLGTAISAEMQRISLAINAPTLAAATFGGLGRDGFVFPNKIAAPRRTRNFRSSRGPTGSTPAARPLHCQWGVRCQTGPSAADAHLEVSFDPGHHDAIDLSTTAIDQISTKW